jgi:hypothetical protein
MERADLLYSGLMFAAGMLSLWTALLLTATFVALAPSFRKSASAAATISSTSSRLLTDLRSEDRRLEDRHLKDRSSAKDDGSQEPTPSSPVSEALSQRTVLGRPLRLIQ